MFNIDDYVMYGTTGVCKVLDITKEKFITGEDINYYVLEPVYYSDTIIKAPVGNDKVLMRNIISKENATSLINDIPNMESVWVDNDKLRNKQFKEIVKSGDCEELIKLAKTTYLNKEYKKSMGQKMYQVDYEIIKEAERLLNEEFATILNMSPSDVSSYINSQINE